MLYFCLYSRLYFYFSLTTVNSMHYTMLVPLPGGVWVGGGGGAGVGGNG